MSSQPIRLFQDARELLEPRLAAAARGDIDQLGKMALTYRVSGGPPGKRLLVVLRISAKGDATYEHSDELLGKQTTRRKMILPKDETLSLLRQAHESGILDLRDTGKGFLPDSTIAAIVVESDESQASYYFLAEEYQQRSQDKVPPSPIRELKFKFDSLCETMRKMTSDKPSAPNKGKKSRGGK